MGVRNVDKKLPSMKKLDKGILSKTGISSLIHLETDWLNNYFFMKRIFHLAHQEQEYKDQKHED